MPRVILHLDLDSFFASVEIAENNLPLKTPLVAGGKFNRGVVSAASYGARKYGIKSGMPIHEAIRLYRPLIIKNTNIELYKSYSDKFFKMVEEWFGDKIEIGSIDECYVDITNLLDKIGKLKSYLKKFQTELIKKLKITCSIGVSNNKFLAKMASDMNKPNGIFVLTKKNIKEFLWPLPIEKTHGIGSKTSPRLRQKGINNIGDLANSFENYEVRNILGSSFYYFMNATNGVDKSEVIDEISDAKSISTSKTFISNLTSLEEIKPELLIMSQKVATSLAKQNLLAQNIGITIKFDNFSQITRTNKQSFLLEKQEDIFIKALALMEKNIKPHHSVRLIGINLSSLINKQHLVRQLNIFEQEVMIDKTQDTINNLNKKARKKIFKKASEV